ncbi:transposase [Acetobacteraceae bacterium]|nr:transposase [Candidatus Parcubacteria bacterium]
MLRKHSFVEGETYHIYNRGAHKQSIFKDKIDYARFLLLLHISNTKKAIETREILKKYGGRSSGEVFKDINGDRVVEIISYCLMPNHFHLVLRQKEENGITIFMKKFATAYSMYFNKKYEHSGTLFQGRFKSSHINNEAYFRYIFSYVHLNPLDIFQPGWKEGIKDINGAKNFLKTYPYFSLPDYPKSSRPEGSVLSFEDMPDFLKTQNDLEDLLTWHNTEDRPPEVWTLDRGLVEV